MSRGRGAVIRWRIWRSAAKLSCVTPYENFWLATAAAAPVIALAAVVVLPDASGLYEEGVQHTVDEWFGPTKKLRDAVQAAGATEAVVEAVSQIDLSDMKKPVAKATFRLRVISAFIWWTVIANVVLQAGLLAFSLAALAYNVDVIPRWLAIVLTVGGILLLAFTVSLVSAYRRSLKEFPKMMERQMVGSVQEIILEVSKAIEEAQESTEEVPSGDDDG